MIFNYNKNHNIYNTNNNIYHINNIIKLILSKLVFIVIIFLNKN
jgi:hypothetical protein